MKSLENWHEYSPLGHAKVLLLHIYSMLPLITLRMAHRLSIIMANTLGSIVCGLVPDGPGFWKPSKLFIIKARAKRGPSLFEYSVHRGIGATWVFPKQVAFIFGVEG